MGLLSSLFNYKASLVQSQTDAQNAQLQYDAAKKQLEAQQDANAQQQEYNKSEAELAFARNSSKGQLAQLMDAGLSEQQARQIIAGGSAGSYTAAPSVNQNQGVDYTALASAKAAQNQAAIEPSLAGLQLTNDVLSSGTLGAIDYLFSDAPVDLTKSAIHIGSSVLQSSLTSSDGGIIGSLSSGKLQGYVTQHINDIPASARGSYAAFSAFASSAAAPAWCKTADFQSALQNASANPFGVKSMRNFFDTSNQLLTGDTYFKNLISESECKSSAAKIASFKVDTEKVATDLAIIENDYKLSILPDRYAAMLTSYQSDIASMAVNRDLWENDDYKKAWLASKLTNAEDAAIIAKVMKMKHNGEFKYLNENPDRAQLFGIYQMFDDAGMTDSLFGQVVASIEAYGESALKFGVTDILKDCKDWIDNKSVTKEAKDTFWQNYLNFNHQPRQ